MTSPPLDSLHGQQCWAWHDTTTNRKHTRSNDVGCGMQSSPLDNTHARTTSGVACHHRLWAADMVERRRARYHITAFGQHTRSNDVGCGMPSSPLGSRTDRTTSGVACHHSPWTTNTIEQRRALHAIIALGRKTRSNDVVRGMPSSLLD